MTEELKQIGERITALREIMGVDAQTLADAVGLPLDEYLKYENGEVDFSFGFVYTIATVLGRDVMEIMTGVAPKLRMATFVRSGGGVKIERQKAYSYEHLAYTFRDKLAEPFLVTVAYDPGKKLPKRNTHEGQEFDYVLEGKLRVSIGEREYLLNPGDSIYYDSSYPHAMQAIDEDVKLIAVVMASGEEQQK